MQRQKTEAEYQATALLLGMFYDRQINTFYRTTGDPEAGLIGNIEYECDADTLAPLSDKEINDRYEQSAKTQDIASYDHGDGW